MGIGSRVSRIIRYIWYGIRRIDLPLCSNLNEHQTRSEAFYKNLHAWTGIFYILLWLFLIACIKHVPNSVKPPIQVRFDATLDEYVFDTFFGSSLTFLALTLGSAIFYLSSSQAEQRFKGKIELGYTNIELDNYVNHERPKMNEFGQREILSMDPEYKIAEKSNRSEWKGNTSATAILCGMGFIFLHIAHYFTVEKNPRKFLAAWVCFVPFSLIVPFISCFILRFTIHSMVVNLYLKIQGIQNSLLVLTSFLFPCAPPLYIHNYGNIMNASYDMSYTIGIVKKKLPYFIIRSIHYINPLSFSSMPSMHAAVASTSFLFINFYIKSYFIRLISVCVLISQWWAILYLNQCYRIDILMGMVYSVVMFNSFKIYCGDFKRVNKIDNYE